MSWFSLSVHGNNAWNTHGSIGRLISGEFIADSVYHHTLRSNSVNLRMRSALTNFFSAWALPKVSPASRIIAQKVVAKTLTPEKLNFLKQRLFEQYSSSSSMDLARFGKNVIKFSFRNVTSRFFCNKSNNETEKINSSSMSEEDKQIYSDKALQYLRKGNFTDAVLVFAELMLLPICEKAVLKTIEGVAKAAAEKSYDLTVKKTCSLVVMPLMYSIFLMAMEAGMNTLNYDYQTSMPDYEKYFPKPVTILSITAMANAIHLGKCIWEESKNHKGTVDFDKEEVKKLAFEKAKTSLAQKLKENEFLTTLEMNHTEENIDNLVKIFVSEMVGFYWKDLHETKVLGLPLVA
jgi:hypothetical protein